MRRDLNIFSFYRLLRILLEKGEYMKRISLSLIFSVLSFSHHVDADDLSSHLKIIELHEQTFKKQQKCLAQAIYFESADKPTSQQAVANVILNRTLTNQYPDTVCGVVNHKTTHNVSKKRVCQFSYVCEQPKKIEYSSDKWKNSEEVAETVLATFVEQDRKDLTNGATHFHDTRVNPTWARSTQFVRTLKASGLSFYKKKK